MPSKASAKIDAIGSFTLKQLTVHAILGLSLLNGQMKDVVTFFNGRAHLLDNLSLILLSFTLTLCRDDDFGEATFGRILKIEVQTFN